MFKRVPRRDFAAWRASEKRGEGRTFLQEKCRPSVILSLCSRVHYEFVQTPDSLLKTHSSDVIQSSQRRFSGQIGRRIRSFSHFEERLYKLVMHPYASAPQAAIEWVEASIVRLFYGKVSDVIGGFRRMKPATSQAAE